jgi:DNA polymerase-3 subunit alpha
MEAAIEERAKAGVFSSLEDFCRRLDSRVANRKMLESLVKCGAFDFLKRDRAELFACIEDSLAAASASHRDRASGQVSLFDELPAPPPKSTTLKVTPWTKHETLTAEKELLGFYVTGHPLDAYAVGMATGRYQTVSSLGELDDRAPFKISGALTQVDKKFTKKDAKPFAIAWLEDLTGTVEVMIWNDVYSKVSDSLVPGKVVAIQGTVDKRDDTVRAAAQKLKVLQPDPAGAVMPARPAPPAVPSRSEPKTKDSQEAAAELVLRFAPSTTSEDLLSVRQILASSPGSTGVQLVFRRPSGEVRLEAGTDFRVEPTAELRERLSAWL